MVAASDIAMVFLQSSEPCEPSCFLCAKLARNNLDASPVVLNNELTGECKVVPHYAVRNYLSMWSPFYEKDHPESRFSPILMPPTRSTSVSSPDTGFHSLDHSASSSPDGRAFPVQRLIEKARFCSMVESTECLRCQKSARDDSGGGDSLSSSRHLGSVFSGAESGRSCTSLLSSSLSNMSLVSFTNTGSNHSGFSSRRSQKDDSISTCDSVKTCSFCYGQHKKHCQKLDRPWPRIQDKGPWHGHAIKTDDGNVECPELFKVMCPLCFATGHEAHTVKFCPLNNV